MVFISALVTSLLFSQGVLSTALPYNNVSPRTASQIDTLLNTVVAPKVRRQVAADATLRPIRLNQLDILLNDGPVRRDAGSDSDGFELTNTEKLVYGLIGDDDTMVMANVTLQSTDGRPLINMESFESSTKNVQCGEKMVLEFISKEAFDSAVASWGWVNEDETHEFIMIANHDGCSPEHQRSPYEVFNADYDEETFTATLDARKALWKEVADTFDVDFGKVQLPASSLRKRGFFDAFFPTLDFGKSVSIDLTQSVENPIIFQTTTAISGFDLTVECLDCGTKGSLDISGKVVVKGFDVKELSIEASPENFVARLEVGVKVAGKAEGPGSTFTAELFSVSLGGISIPGIFTLGPTLDYEAGFSTNLEGSAELSYGVLARLDNAAIIKADLINSNNNQFSGWEPIVEQIPFKINAEAKATISAFSQPVLALTFDVIGLPAFEAAIKMRLPEVTAELTALTSSDGVCGDASKTAGVQVNAEIGVDITFRVGEEANFNEVSLFEQQLFAFSTPLFDACFPIF